MLDAPDLVSRGFDEGPLFENVGFELQAGERVGLVGRIRSLASEGFLP